MKYSSCAMYINSVLLANNTTNSFACCLISLSVAQCGQRGPVTTPKLGQDGSLLDPP